jgi:hypothetical protein
MCFQSWCHQCVFLSFGYAYVDLSGWDPCIRTGCGVISWALFHVISIMKHSMYDGVWYECACVGLSVCKAWFHMGWGVISWALCRALQVLQLLTYGSGLSIHMLACVTVVHENYKVRSDFLKPCTMVCGHVVSSVCCFFLFMCCAMCIKVVIAHLR